MSENLKQTILRFALIFIGISVMFVIVLAQIVYIQTAEKDKWEKASKQSRASITRPIPATRAISTTAITDYWPAACLNIPSTWIHVWKHCIWAAIPYFINM